jgi:hypothetical protein
MTARPGALLLWLVAGVSGCAPERVSPPAQQPPPSKAPVKAPSKPPVEAPKPPAPPPKDDAGGTPSEGMKEAFPHVRVDRAARVVEIDGIVPIDAHDKETPDVYLEVMVCTRDSKEHESLVMTDAKPSQVHAALLLLGLAPGKPGSVEFDGKTLKRSPPTGDGVRVTIAYKDAQGKEVESSAADWIVKSDRNTRLAPKGGSRAWVFAGSRFVTRNGKEWYDADGAGTLVGLTTFGGETVAWTDVQSPESAVDEPEWIADAAKVPAFGTPVIVRIRPAK